MVISAKNTLISFILYFSKESMVNDLWNKLLQEKPTGHVGSSETEILRCSLMLFFFPNRCYFTILCTDHFILSLLPAFICFIQHEELELDSLLKWSKSISFYAIICHQSSYHRPMIYIIKTIINYLIQNTNWTEMNSTEQPEAFQLFWEIFCSRTDQ